MKNFILLILFLSGLATSGAGQGLPHCSMDSTYVWARNGLSLRTEANKQGDRIEIIPFGTRLRLLSPHYVYHYGHDKVDSIRLVPRITNNRGKDNKELHISSNWIQVETDGQTGYVFGAYLSRIRPIELDTSNVHDIEAFLIGSSDIVLKQENSEMRYQVYTVRSNGTSHNYNEREGGGVNRYFIPGNYNFKDGFALLNFFVDFDKLTEDLEQYSSITSETEKNHFKNTTSIDIYFKTKGGGGLSYRLEVDEHGLYFYFSGHC